LRSVSQSLLWEFWLPCLLGIGFKMPISIVKDRVNEIEKIIRELASKQVLVGIPEDKSGRRAEQGINPVITNAALGYIHEQGSPAQNIPSRAWLVPGVAAGKDKTADYFKQAGVAAFEGDKAKADKALNIAGQYNVNTIKARISQGIPPPLKHPRRVRGTTAAARARNRKAQAAAGAGQETPLIDTAQFINSINYVIRKKGGRK
jgi:hypothetical protein